MRVTIGDGYTLSGETQETWGSYQRLHVVKFKYRPPTWEEIIEFQHRHNSAATGHAQAAAAAEFVAAHVTEWDVDLAGKDGDRATPAPITAKSVASLPEPVGESLFNVVRQWQAPQKDGKPSPAEQAAGN